LSPGTSRTKPHAKEVSLDDSRTPGGESRRLVVDVILTEYATLRQEMVHQVGRQTQLVTFGIGGSVAVVSAAATWAKDAVVVGSIAMVLAAGLALVTVAYIGVLEQELMLSEYLRDQAAQLRRLVASDPPLGYVGKPPLLSWEDRVAEVADLTLMKAIGFALGSFELGSLVFTAAAFFAGGAWLYLTSPVSGASFGAGLMLLDTVMVLVVLGAVGHFVYLEYTRPKAAAPDIDSVATGR
jgi:hypothetical protein